MEKLQDLYSEGKLNERWIFCLGKDGEPEAKKPIVFCLQGCEKASECPSHEHYEDFSKILKDVIDGQKNPSLDIEFKNFMTKLNERFGRDLLGDNPVEENSGKVKKVKKSAKKKVKKSVDKPDPAQDPDPGTTPQENTEPKIQKKKAKRKIKKASPVVLEIIPDRFVLLPTKLDSPEVRGFVTEEKLEALLDKFESEGEDVSVFKIASHNIVKKSYDYLVVPASECAPELIKKDELMCRIEDYESEDIDIQIFEVGKQLRYRKEIIIEEAE